MSRAALSRRQLRPCDATPTPNRRPAPGPGPGPAGEGAGVRCPKDATADAERVRAEMRRQAEEPTWPGQWRLLKYL
jgi:hypothetical protein